MKLSKRIGFLFFFFLPILFFAGNADAITLSNGKWSTTFNCNDWAYPPDSPIPGCDGIERSIDGNSGYILGINSSANNPSGAGGKGLSWQVGNGSGQSTSPASANIGLSWSGSNNVWIRWYVSLPSGMPIQSCTLSMWKLLYVYGSSLSDSFYVDTEGYNVISLYDRVKRSTGSYGFDDIYGASSNGSWAAIEMHFDIPNSVWEYWVYENNTDNATAKYRATNVQYPMSSIGYIKFPENIKSSCIPGAPVTFKFDDITISTTGRIGPVSGGGTQTCSNCCSSTQTCSTGGFTTVGTCTRCCASGTCQTASGDTTLPVVSAFSVTPTTLTVGASLTANYTVTDNTALSRAELWRAPSGTNCTDTVKTGCVWTQVTSANITGTSRTGTFTSSPTAAGTFYYGLHAVDAAGNVGNESSAVRVVVNAATQTCTNCCSTTQTCPTAFTTVGSCTRCCATACQTVTGGGQTLLTESFNDANFSSRGWFDAFFSALDTTTKYAGNSSAKFTWTTGATTPTGIPTMRHDITPTDSLYVSFYWRFNTDWIGSGQPYHPHIVYILSDLDNHWGALAKNYLDTYIETTNLTPAIYIQDGLNIVTSPTVPWTNTNNTENRAVAGCNGITAGADAGSSISCYNSGGWMNGIAWQSPVNFSRGTWHHVETYFKMNTIAGSVAQPNGEMRMWIDGNPAITKTNIVYRTNQHPTLKWGTFVLAPYIGDSSPRVQTMWMDELTVGTTNPYAGGTPGDMILPRVTAFTITPTTLTVGASLTANYTVTDNTALARAELWRAPSGTNCTDTVKTGCVWTQVTSANITGTSRTGTFTSSPTAAGTFYYGLHAVDAANNVGYEPAPVRVTINAPTQTCSNCCSTTQTCPTAFTTVGTCTRCCASTCQTTSACGNGNCETGETCSSCASDCGACPGGQCQKLSSGSAIPAGYGAPYNTLSSSGEQLMNVVCNANSASVSIGNNSTSQYIYRYGYIWRNNAWQRIDLVGPTPAYEGNWFRGSANATVSLTAAELAQENNLIAYICNWTPSTSSGQAGEWKCGCRDANCATAYWQLQRFGNY